MMSLYDSRTIITLRTISIASKFVLVVFFILAVFFTYVIKSINDSLISTFEVTK